MGQTIGGFHFAVQEIVQRSTFGILHNQVCRLLGQADAVQRNDVRMLDSRQLFNLLLDVLLFGTGKELLDGNQLITPDGLAHDSVRSMADFLWVRNGRSQIGY